MAKKLIPLTIDRTKWRRGDYAGDKYSPDSKTLLLDPNTKTMCCLGFACRASGLGEAIISNKAYPANVLNSNKSTNTRRANKIRNMLTETNHTAGRLEDCETVAAAVSINDADYLDESDRERELRPVLRELGYKVKFVGKRPPPPEADE